MKMYSFTQKNITQELHTTEYTTIKDLSILHGHIVGILENYKLLASRYGEISEKNKDEDIERSNQIESILLKIQKDRDDLNKNCLISHHTYGAIQTRDLIIQSFKNTNRWEQLE